MTDVTTPAGQAPSRKYSPGMTIYQQLKGMWTARAIACAAQLGIADALKDEAKSITELAHITETYEPFLLRLLRALASLDIFMEVSPNVFANTELSAVLRSDVKDSMYGMACLMGSPREWSTWQALDSTVKTGVPAMEHLYGMTFWQFLEAHPEEGKHFHEAMTNISETGNKAIAAALDTADISTIMDVGGGEGSLLLAILQTSTHLKAILFDQPVVIEQARSHLVGSGFEDRIVLVAGNVFEALPARADAYILKKMLHGSNDDECRVMLKQCRNVLTPKDRLLIIEHILLPGKQTTMGKFLDLQMMLQQEGRERYEDEFRALFQSAGLTLRRIIPTASPDSILEVSLL